MAKGTGRFAWGGRALVLAVLLVQFLLGAAMAAETFGRTIKGLESRTAGRALEVVRDLRTSGAIQLPETAEAEWRVASAFQRAAQEEARGYAARVYWGSLSMMGLAALGAGVVIAKRAEGR